MHYYGEQIAITSLLVHGPKAGRAHISELMMQFCGYLHTSHVRLAKSHTMLQWCDMRSVHATSIIFFPKLV